MFSCVCVCVCVCVCNQDKSWRVRYMVADKFCDLVKSIGDLEAKETRTDELVDG